MTDLKLTFRQKTPRRWDDLISREPWLFSDEEVRPVKWQDWILPINEAFKEVKSNFLYAADTSSPWGAFKQIDRIMTEGTVFQGDCDFFAIRCLSVLNDAGLPVSSMRLILCYDGDNVAHMISCILTDHGTVIMDNQFDKPVGIPDVLNRGYKLTAASSCNGIWQLIHN